jgi:hypothetical protein
MSILFSASSSVNHGTSSISTALFILSLAAVIALVAWLNSSWNRFKNPTRTIMTNQQREVRADSLTNMVRATLWLVMVCAVIFVKLYEIMHAGSG